jgi:putative nucleotidyltransferase-like protein
MDTRTDREILAALFAALEDPARAPALGDDPRVLVVARRHRLTPLLSMTCRATLPPALGDTCRRDHVLTAARNLALGAVAEECIAALAAAGIEAALLKGLAYERTLYPQTGARPTSDIDLLVRDRDRRAAFDVLDRLGFEPRGASPGFDEPDYHEVAWNRGGVEVDLHLALAPYARCAIDYDAVWRDVRPLDLGAARALAPPHAAVFHVLHMAIDHFDVPALYLADLARLLATADEVAEARAAARAWRCARPLATSLAIAAAFQPSWAAALALEPTPTPRRAARVAAGFGGLAPLPRPRQLWRKYEHFDTAWDALRYTQAQGRRHARELVERHVRRRSVRARLGLASRLSSREGN